MNKKDLDKLESKLNEIINLSLYGGGSDPLWENLMSAKYAYESLKILNLKVKDESEIIAKLSGDNIDGANYLAD